MGINLNDFPKPVNVKNKKKDENNKPKKVPKYSTPIKEKESPKK